MVTNSNNLRLFNSSKHKSTIHRQVEFADISTGDS